MVAMELAQCAGSYSAAALSVLLAPSQRRPSLPPLDVPGVPRQTEIDRLLSVYEQWVEIDVALPEVEA